MGTAPQNYNLGKNYGEMLKFITVILLEKIQ